MKKIIKLGLTSVLLIAVVMTALMVYNKLNAEYQGNNLITDQATIAAQLNQQPSSESESSPHPTQPLQSAPQDESAPTDPSPQGSTLSDNGEATTDDTSSNENNVPPAPPSPPKNPAPDFTVLDENGNRVKLSDFRGKPVVLNFWATWCYYCTVEMPHFNEAYKKYPDVQFLMVNVTDGVRDTVDSAKKLKSDNGYEFEIFFDTEGSAKKAYNITSYPSTYFISAEGEVIAAVRGMLNMPSLEKGIAMILPRTKEE